MKLKTVLQDTPELMVDYNKNEGNESYIKFNEERQMWQSKIRVGNSYHFEGFYHKQIDAVRAHRSALMEAYCYH